MKKLYAIVSPAYTAVNHSIKDLSSFVINPAHHLLYEQVCGYSLGHEVEFFDSLEDTKKSMESGLCGSKTDSRAAAQKAIIELNVNDEEKITGFCKIHTAAVEKLFEKTEQGFFKKVRLPIWIEGEIDSTHDVSYGALEELNSLYQNYKNPQKHQSMFEVFNEFGI